MEEKIIYKFIVDYWKLIHKYLPIPDDKDEAAWENMYMDFSKLSNKYRDGSIEAKFFTSLITEWWEYTRLKNGGINPWEF